MSEDRFKQAEDEFFRLKGQLAAGRITPEQFEAARQNLVVCDAEGRSWMLSADSGLWQRQESQTSKRTAASITPESTSIPQAGGKQEELSPPPETKPPAQPPHIPAPPRRRRSCLGGCLRFFGILLLILLGVALIAAIWPAISQKVQSFGPGLRPGACRSIVPVVTSEQATGDKLICQFGLADAVSIQQLASGEAALKQIASYTEMQKKLLPSLAKVEGFADRSTWATDAAIYDVRATFSGKPVYTKEGLLLYRDRYLIQVRLSNWGDEAALKARWDALVASARKLIDDKFK